MVSYFFNPIVLHGPWQTDWKKVKLSLFYLGVTTITRIFIFKKQLHYKFENTNQSN